MNGPGAGAGFESKIVLEEQVYDCRIIADSVNPSGDRLTTFQLTFPWFISQGFLTHRIVSCSERTAELGVAQEPGSPVLNRWKWITVVCSGTEYEDFFRFPVPVGAEPQMWRVVDMMKDAYETSVPKGFYAGEYHLPYVTPDELRCLGERASLRVSAARCARAVRLNKEGIRAPVKDVLLAGDMMRSGRWEPFQHQAVAMEDGSWHSNFRGWKPYLSLLEDSKDYVPPPPEPVEAPPVAHEVKPARWGWVSDEVDGSVVWCGPFNTPRQGYGVLLEQLDGLWDVVKRQGQDRDALLKKAGQLAASACRFADQVEQYYWPGLKGVYEPDA